MSWPDEPNFFIPPFFTLFAIAAPGLKGATLCSPLFVFSFLNNRLLVASVLFEPSVAASLIELARPVAPPTYLKLLLFIAKLDLGVN